MKDLNVCLLNDSFPPTIDGVANVVFNYADILQKQHGNVIVATPSYPDVKDDYDFEVLRYPSIDTTKLVGYRAGMPFDIDYLSKFNNRNIDILHTHTPITSTFLARMIQDNIKKPIILTYHTKFDIDIQKAFKSKLIQDTAIKALVSNIEACDEVWTVSKGAGENLKSLGYKGDYIVMNNGVDFPKSISSPEEIEETKQKYNLPKGLPIYLFVGRMMWYKGIKIIVDALRIKANHNQDFRMLFVGDGIDNKEIQQYIKDNDLLDKCVFAGMISDRSELKKIFSSCDLFLFPSTFDTNGIVVREAASSGLASVLIKGSCASEDTLDGINCIQIEENAESLAKVLIDADNNVDYFHKLGLNAQQQLYISWQDAVENAYERYKIVNEKYVFNNKYDSGDLLFSTFAQLSEGYSSIKQAQKEIDLLFLAKKMEGKEKILSLSDELFEKAEERIDNQINDLLKKKEKLKQDKEKMHNSINQLERYF